VDERSPGEYARGQDAGSVNIPVNALPSQLSKFKDRKNIMVICRSGSSLAKSILKQNDFTNVVNCGTWENVGQFVN